MTTQTKVRSTAEALKLARKLLWRYRHETPIGRQPHMICQEVDEAFERIDEALAQPKRVASQEPVAWGVIASNTGKMCQVELDYDEVSDINSKWLVPLYTTPPQRTWVGLTDEDVRQCSRDVAAGGKENCVDRFAYAIEAKLKEKNG